jgi:uncharacterized protein YkwD
VVGQPLSAMSAPEPTPLKTVPPAADAGKATHSPPTVESIVPTARRTTRSLTAVLLAVALTLGLAGPAAAQTLEPDLETRLVSLTNKARAANGKPALRVELQLTRIARDWSNTMATRQDLAHRPSLGSAITGNWSRIGENVGVGSDVARIHDAFMNSSGHRGNILGDYDRIGVGIYERDGRYWITVNFLKGSGDFPVFRDVTSNTHRANIEGLFARGTTLGCSGDRYCPSASVTRGQMATFLARELGLSPRTADFRDVSSSNPHAGAIGALAARGITTGCDTGRFCPGDTVSRAQMATFLRRALNLTERAPSGLTDISGTHAGSVGALQHAGITQGCSATRYCPVERVSRAQMATFLQRAFA